jgi:maltose O-acetyltransferase
MRAAIRRLLAFKARMGMAWRRRMLDLILKRLGRGVLCYGWPTITFPERVEIGDGTTINQSVFLGGRGGIIIGREVRLSTGSILETGYLHQEPGKRIHAAKPIRVGDNVWVASGALILAGVTIGNNSIIGAGAVVTKDVPPDSLALGIPARSRPFGAQESLYPAGTVGPG